VGGTKLSEVTPVGSKIESSVEAEVASVITKRFDGIKNRDETTVRAIFDERYNKFDDWPPFMRQEAEEALKNEFGAFKVLSNYSYELKDFKVNAFGDIAIAAFHLHYQGEIRNRRFDINSRVTSVLRRQDSGWKIVHEHFSRFPEGSISGGTSETVQSTPPPSTPSYPPARNMTRKFTILAFISAVLSLFIAPEVFGPVAIIFGAYAWRKEQGNSGFTVLILGITCMLVGLYFTAIFALIDILPS
jgi:ketosteroid isomerase-like protein